MAIEIKAPAFPESVADGVISTWHKKQGDSVKRDELLVDIETDKVVMEVMAPVDGVLTEVLKAEGATVLSQEILGWVSEGAVAEPLVAVAALTEIPATTPRGMEPAMGPAARKLVAEHGLEAEKIAGQGKGGRIRREDVVDHLKTAAPAAASQPATTVASPAAAMLVGERVERRVPMTRLRVRIAQRLLEAKQSTAMLTTFNEVNMAPVMALRKQYGEKFEKTHGVKLGFMSFFVKAAVEALRRFPGVNASIDGQDIIYHGYQDIGVAVSSEKGLVVPILRDVEHMSLSEIESKIGEFGKKARDGKLTIEEMTGGTFSISNGGIFGSLLSTPILNPPQTAILGMHKIQERPMAVNGQVVILPMMYLAVSYDHRLIDGKEAVSFLVAIKEMVEDPTRILLEM